MSDSKELSRRRLLGYGASAPFSAALGFTVATGLDLSDAEGAPAQVPRRVLGKTQQSIPILLVGGGAGFKGGVDPRIKLAIEHGANYIDTARKYAGGASERNAGSALVKLKARDKVWITSKTPQWSAAGLKQDVAFSLASLQTNRIDLYFLHGLDTLAPLNDKELVKATLQLKREKKIRFFGFSCHGGNVVELLQAAAQRSFVDAVMFRYSFRDYGDKELNRAIDAAHKAGVGLIAMKTQGSESGFRDAWQKFEQTGKWNKHQAVLKAVWADARITALVSHMETTSQLRENLAAALDGAPLGQRETEAVRRYAELTRPYACQGCDHLCNPHVQAPVRIGTTLRCLMYHDSYGDPEKARRVFRELPVEAQRLAGVDFSGANRACPHGIDVAAHMQRAADLFTS
jgi:predicted aldo/keto reductase-like oxidoreductase